MADIAPKASINRPPRSQCRASHHTSACSTAHGITSIRKRWFPSPWRAARLIETQPSMYGMQAGTWPAWIDSR